MKKYFLVVFFTLNNFIFANSILEDNYININSKNKIHQCFAYMPDLGEVDDIDSLEVESDNFEIKDNEILILKNNVNVDFPNGFLKADFAKIDRINKKIEFKNGGKIYLENYLLKSNRGSLDRNNKSISLNQGDVFFNQRGLIFSFEDLDGDLDGVISLDDVSITSCVDVKNGWKLHAKKIELDNSANRGIAKNVNVKIRDKSLLWLPVLPFPLTNERMSGFLEPSFSYSSDGIDLSIPYFKVITDSSDITLSMRNISDRGLGIEGNYRELHGQNSNYRDVSFIYFFDDKNFELAKSNNDKSRWAYSLRDKLEYSNSSLQINWSKASDSLFFRDIPGEITSIGGERNQILNQSISFYTKLNNLSINISHDGLQNLNPLLTNGYKKSPSINFYFSKNLNGFNYRQKLNISSFKASSLHGFFGYDTEANNYSSLIEDPIEGSRIFSDISFNKDSYVENYLISYEFGIKSINYNLEKSVDSKSVNVPNIKIDIRSLFVKSKGMSSSIFMPRLVIGYAKYKNQDANPVFDTHSMSMNNELFNNRRFTGMDRIGDQKFYTLSIEYKKRKMGMDKFSFSLSKKYYLEKSKVKLGAMAMPMPMPMMNDMLMSGMNNPIETDMTMNNSMAMHMMDMDEGPIVLMTKWMPNMQTMIMGYSGYIEDQKKVPLGGLNIKQQYKKGSFGFAKRYRRMSGDFNHITDYSEIYGDIKLNTNFRIIGKFIKDHEFDEKVESVFGLSYENCCISLRLTSSDKNLSSYLIENNQNTYANLNDAWDNILRLENKSRINFQFELKGLSSSFKKFNQLMNDSLLNY